MCLWRAYELEPDLNISRKDYIIILLIFHSTNTCICHGKKVLHNGQFKKKIKVLHNNYPLKNEIFNRRLA